MTPLISNFVHLFVESAPWLMLGFAIAGIMRVFVPSELLAKHLGEPGFVATAKAAMLGAPLPLCSCGVIPAALGLRRSGASKAATTSFLISTPETGVDSVAVSYAMLGPFMAIIRPIAAITTAITAGLLVGPDDKATADQPKSTESTCCAAKQQAQTEEVSCCNTDQNTKSDGVLSRIHESLRFTFVDLIKDTSLWLLIGLGMAAMVKTYVPSEFLTQWGDGFMAFVVMALIGVPMYICAIASTPIAAGLLFSGISPGATLVFMLVGPATNIATIGLVRRELGNRALTAYIGSVVGVGFAFGYLTNYLADQFAIQFNAQADNAHIMINTPLAMVCAVVLAGFMLRAIISKYAFKSATA
jgi:uncharacterized membrane protein YraQ (UPF0718 family)